MEELFQELLQQENVRERLIALRERLRAGEDPRRLKKLADAQGNPFGELLHHADPKVRKNAALLLGELGCQQQLTELSDLSRQRGQMLGSLAHELKTPMTSIIGYTDTLLHVKIKENQQKRALTHIYQESRRLERLGSKLMNLIGSYDNESIRLQKTDISDLFARVKALERPNLDKKQIQLHTDCHIGQLLLDSDLFESLLINLIDNAIKASSPGSAVYLTGKENSISVKDEGHGIPSKDLRRVTEAFYMVDKARSRKEGGCGLGLSLCSMIARLHRAELIIDSQEGKGTTVSILFKDE